MSGGRPRTPIGIHGTINTRRTGDRVVAEARVRDLDGRLRQVRATGATAAAARTRLLERIRERPQLPSGGVLRPTSPFPVLADLWLADLELRDLADNTKEGYRSTLRLHVRPAFEHYTLAEVTTGRVEWFLTRLTKVSPSTARQSRTLLNMLFGYALRHDAIGRNPVEGTSQLRQSKATPRALTLAQIAAIRDAAARWRTEPGLPGPKPDGQVRDIIEVLLGTAMRPGEVLALRPCDLTDGPGGMVAAVTGTVVQGKGAGAHRQGRPKTDASIRRIPVPEFAAEVLRRRLAPLGPGEQERTIFANRTGGPLSPHNVRRTFREFLGLAGLADSGISLRWYRRTGATVIARGMGTDAAATFLGHTSTVITEGHYIERDRTIDTTPAAHLERTLRPVAPDAALLAMRPPAGESAVLDAVDDEDDADDSPRSR
ncbi:site-specific integrase [Nocardioides sp. GY 10113]|uniref:site-specific integrase n=1 Tax=Nocardioides sp. GY 10113 TaxID=2569761 RepID=UPI0010A7DEB2|nr:tyrosine-type recombinase/integrase [Nocardioides sp. GY 10113]TIC88245.1 site-specific integrase [Nocardioides sp. GY 10113]